MRLLRSKIRAPVVPDLAIDRPRLLKACTTPRRPLVLLHAPAGYGKSILAAQIFVVEPNRTAWLFLEPEDADPRRFCAYLLGSLSAVIPSLERTELTRSLDQSEFQATAWIEDLILFFQEFTGPPTRLILDNFESVVAEATITRLVQRLLDHAGPGLAILITTREATGIGWQKLSERGSALVLTAKELAFDLEELDRVARKHGDSLSAKELEAMWTRSEGWCVYLGLYPISARSTQSMGPRESSSYLNAEIMDRLPDETVQFLRSMCVLDVISEEGMAALGLDPAAFASRIADLARYGVPHLTVTPGAAVRLHPLIRETLIAGLRSGPDVQAVAARACGFYRATGRFEFAMRVLLELGEFEAALDLLTAGWEELSDQGLATRIPGWLGLLPAPLHRRPDYILARTRSLHFQGENRTIVEYLDALRERGEYPEGSSSYPQLWIIEAWARTLLGRFVYEDLLGQWKQLEAQSSDSGWLAAQIMLCNAALYGLRFTVAEGHLREAMARSHNSPTNQARTLNAMGTVLHEQGRSSEALEIYEKGLAFCSQHDEKAYRTLHQLGLSFTYKDLGRYGSALETLDACLDVERSSGSTRKVILPHAARTRGEVYWYLGRESEAFEQLEASYRWFADNNHYEGLATGVLLDHWCSISGKRSQLISEADFEGGLQVSEAHVRFLIRRSRQETDQGNPRVGIEAAQQAEGLAAEMPSWRACAKFCQAWGYAAQHEPTATRVAVHEGLQLLEQIDRSAYPMADSALTAFVVVEAVTWDLLADRAIALVTGEGHVELYPALSARLGSAELSSEQAARLVDLAARCKVRGLGPQVDATQAPQDLKLRYQAEIAGSPLPAVWVRMFGKFEAVVSGREVRFSRKAARRLLQILLLAHHTPVHEERLMDFIWPDADPQGAKRNLQTAVNELRRALNPHHRSREDSYVVYRESAYELDLPPGSQVDLHVFRRDLSALLGTDARRGAGFRARLHQTLALYRGELLADDPYEEYAAEPREQERQSMLEGSAILAAALSTQNPELASQVLQRGLEVDPLWSEGVSLMMRSLRQQGRILAAIRIYRDHEKRLDQELGVAPDEPLRRLFEGLLQTRD